MSARLRLVAAALAVVLVAVPIVFGLVDGTTGTLVGLAFSMLAVLVTGSAYAVLKLVDRHIAQAERRLRKEIRMRPKAQQPKPVKLPKGLVTVAHLKKERDFHAKRTQDIVNLFSMVPITSGIPPLGLWTASADLLVELVDRLVTERPATVVEGGSGVSTVVMALAAKEHGIPVKIVALEAQPVWAEHTRAMLARHGVAEYAEVRLAPLARTSIAEHETPWYDEGAIADLSGIGLLLVDGPPEGTGERARYPMVPLLKDKLADRCTILVDDTGRPSDADVVERWKPLLPDFDFEVLHLDKGAALLTRK
ncbi:class I SAM-dependent methyltransferase [Nocardioides sp. SR21]|uniref:class I SAM-dependent methyltransferase n=1 Tax=Nocardioides sp. SR21 TaxID=2919501 RepID=UPI001FA95E7C|nr:class I SAM-dependent methyltransferase [Nocardioides sp. SR21]